MLTAKIANGAVTTDKLADKAVTSAKLADNAVTTPKIQNSAVNAEKLAGEAVTTGKIANEAVTTGKLGNEAVTVAKLGNGSVHASKLGAANFTLGGSVSVPAGETSATALDCPAGSRMLSGGPINVTTDKDLVVLGSHPNASNQWRVQMYNGGAAAASYSIVVHCLVP